MSINHEKNYKYLVYRCGSDDKIELEYPLIKDSSTFKNFIYTSYLRGGGPTNAGMELNYLEFKNENFKYVVYQTYFSERNEYKLGIKIFDKDNTKVQDIHGIQITQIGSLVDFRFDELNLLVLEGDSLYY